MSRKFLISVTVGLMLAGALLGGLPASRIATSLAFRATRPWRSRLYGIGLDQDRWRPGKRRQQSRHGGQWRTLRGVQFVGQQSRGWGCELPAVTSSSVTAPR